MQHYEVTADTLLHLWGAVCGGGKHGLTLKIRWTTWMIFVAVYFVVFKSVVRLHYVRFKPLRQQMGKPATCWLAGSQLKSGENPQTQRFKLVKIVHIQFSSLANKLTRQRVLAPELLRIYIYKKVCMMLHFWLRSKLWYYDRCFSLNGKNTSFDTWYFL